MKRIAYTIFSAMLIVAVAFKASAQSGETRQVSGFNTVASAGPFEVHVKINGTESLKINASQDALKEIDTYVEDGKLQIKFKHRNHRDGDRYGKIDVYITAKSLSALENAGSGSIKVDGTLSGRDVNISLSGSGNISSSVKAGDFHAAISGSGSIELNGSAGKTDISIAGSGDLNGKSFRTENASVSIAGSGNARFGADKSVSANIVGSGNVVYSGNASVTNSSTIGSGRVSKAD